MSTPGLGAREYHGIRDDKEERELHNIDSMTHVTQQLAEHRAKIESMSMSTEERIAKYQLEADWPIVCICGSMRFYEAMQRYAQWETLEGKIVLLPLVVKDADMSPADLKKQQQIEQGLPDGVNLHIMLDAMHREKIDMASEIVVVTNQAGYFGESTRNEIAYAALHLKTIRFYKGASGYEREFDK